MFCIFCWHFSWMSPLVLPKMGSFSLLVDLRLKCHALMLSDFRVIVTRKRYCFSGEIRGCRSEQFIRLKEDPGHHFIEKSKPFGRFDRLQMARTFHWDSLPKYKAQCSRCWAPFCEMILRVSSNPSTFAICWNIKSTIHLHMSIWIGVHFTDFCNHYLWRMNEFQIWTT